MKCRLTILFLLSLTLCKAQMSPALRFYDAHMGLYKTDTSTATDADATAFLTATGITDPTITSAINRFVLDLKGVPNALYHTSNIWDSMFAIYPFVGGTATTCKYNLKDPRDADNAYRLTFVGTYSFTANEADFSVSPFGYADSHFPVQSFSVNGLHLSYYQRHPTPFPSNSSGLSEMGAFGNNSGVASCASGFARIVLTPAWSATQSPLAYSFIGESDGTGRPCVVLQTTNATSQIGVGFYMNNTIQSGTSVILRTYKNAVQQATSSVSSAYLYYDQFHNNIYVGAAASNTTLGTAGEAGRQTCAFASIGKGFSTTQLVLDYTNAVQQFQTTLGRAVN